MPGFLARRLIGRTIGAFVENPCRWIGRAAKSALDLSPGATETGWGSPTFHDLRRSMLPGGSSLHSFIEVIVTFGKSPLSTARRDRSALRLSLFRGIMFAAAMTGAGAKAQQGVDVGGAEIAHEMASGSGDSGASPTSTQFPLRLPVVGGEVILPTPGARRAHDDHRYAAARRVGDFLYLSGVIISRQPEEGRDVDQFKDQVRRRFERVRATLAAGCATFENVVKITSFHVWDSPDFVGSRDAQFAAFSEVLGEFIPSPYPAWTAVGTTGLLGEGGIVEVEFIAHVAPGDRSCTGN